MKKFALLFLLTLPLFQSCKKEKEPVTADNFVVFDLNGSRWTGRSEINFNRITKRLTILGIKESGSSEIIVMRINFTGTGNYMLKYDEGYYYTLIGGDVIDSDYKFEDGVSGSLYISKFDETANIVEGHFEFELKKAHNGAVPMPEIAKIKNGLFSGKINLFVD